MANRAQQDAIQEHEESLEILWTVVNALEDSTEASVQDLKSHLKVLEHSPAGKASDG